MLCYPLLESGASFVENVLNIYLLTYSFISVSFVQ